MKNIKQKLTIFAMSVAAVLAVGATVVMPQQVMAAEKCGGVATSIIKCDTTDDPDTEETGLWQVLIIAINILIAGVGVLALGGIVYGAVLYTSAGGNSDQVKKAREVFTNVVIGVIAFGGMWALLNFLVPGGVFN